MPERQSTNATITAARRLLLKSMTGYEPEIVRALLDAGADVNARDRSGTAPMHKAYTLEILKVLLDAGADVNARNESGSTPLHGARTPEIAQALLNAGAQVNVRDEFGFTALHCAVGCPGLGPRAEIIQTLLRRRCRCARKKRKWRNALGFGPSK